MTETAAMKPKKAERDARVTQLYEQLIEIEQRLIPTGLHVFGRAAELKEKADLLRMVASFDRPEHGVRALPRLVGESLGFDCAVLNEGPSSETKELIDGIVFEALSRFCEDGAEHAAGWLKSKASVEVEDSLQTFKLLEKISEQLDSNHEIESLMRALR